MKSQTSEQIIIKVLDIHRQLKVLRSLKPRQQTNKLFGELVALTRFSRESVINRVLADERIIEIQPSLHRICSLGEFELEKYWCAKILKSKHPAIELENFPYYKNYDELTNLEYYSLKSTGEREIKNVLFIGSGPMPLTSILFAKNFHLRVGNVEIDKEACDLSRTLAARIGLADMLTFYNTDILNFSRIGEYDVVCVGALVGLNNKEKSAVISHVRSHMKEGALVVVRTAHYLRTLLYPQVDPDLFEGLTPHLVIQPLNEVVNSVLIAEKPIRSFMEHVVIEDKTNKNTFRDFKHFALSFIKEIYHYEYNPLWHSDIDRAGEVYDTPISNVFVAYKDGEAIATLAIRPYDREYRELKKRYNSKDTAGVWRFFVAKPYRNKGLEELLHAKAEAFCRAAGFNMIYAHDQKDISGAIKKYIDLGYRIVHEDQDTLGTVHIEKIIAQ